MTTAVLPNIQPKFSPIFQDISSNCALHFATKVQFTNLHGYALNICILTPVCVLLMSKSVPKTLEREYDKLKSHDLNISQYLSQAQWNPNYPDYIFPIYFHAFKITRFRQLCIVQISSTPIVVKHSASEISSPDTLFSYKNSRSGIPHLILFEILNNLNSIIKISQIKSLFPLSTNSIILMFDLSNASVLMVCMSCNGFQEYRITPTVRATMSDYKINSRLIIIESIDTASVYFIQKIWYKLQNNLHSSHSNNDKKINRIEFLGFKYIYFKHNCSSKACLSYFKSLITTGNSFREYSSKSGQSSDPNLLQNFINDFHLYSYGVFRESINFVVFVMPNTYLPAPNILSLFSPITKVGWVIVLTTIIFLAVTLKFTGVRHNLIQWLISSLLEQEELSRKFINYKNMLLVSAWIYTGLLLRTIYTSSVFSHITQSQDLKTSNNISELIGSVYQMKHFNSPVDVQDNNWYYIVDPARDSLPEKNLISLNYFEGMSLIYGTNTQYFCTVFTRGQIKTFLHNISNGSDVYCKLHSASPHNQFFLNLGAVSNFVLSFNEDDGEILIWKFLLNALKIRQPIPRNDNIKIHMDLKFYMAPFRHFFIKHFTSSFSRLYESGILKQSEFLDRMNKLCKRFRLLIKWFPAHKHTNKWNHCAIFWDRKNEQAYIENQIKPEEIVVNLKSLRALLISKLILLLASCVVLLLESGWSYKSCLSK